MREALVFILAMVGTVGVLAHCQPKPEVKTAVENAAAVAQYTALLDQCRAQGRASNSFAVYQACADAVDDHLCSQHRLRCPEDR
jgi:hypothetical protein